MADALAAHGPTGAVAPGIDDADTRASSPPYSGRRRPCEPGPDVDAHPRGLGAPGPGRRAPAGNRYAVPGADRRSSADVCRTTLPATGIFDRHARVGRDGDTPSADAVAHPYRHAFAVNADAVRHLPATFNAHGGSHRRHLRASADARADGDVHAQTVVHTDAPTIADAVRSPRTDDGDRTVRTGTHGPRSSYGLTSLTCACW
jgi:hypothetical protein